MPLGACLRAFSQRFLLFCCFSAFLLFSAFEFRLFSAWRCTRPGVHPSVHPSGTPTDHTSRLVRHVYHCSTCAMCTFSGPSGRTRCFQNRLFQARNVSGSSRLDRQRDKTTCVWQAKSLKQPRTEFYSGSLKRELPEMSSFSGPGGVCLNGQALEC